MDRNRHLNLFEHYDQPGAMPIENNVSRGLGIILQENPSVLFLLLNKLKEKSEELQDIPFPTDSYSVNFQVPADKFEPAQCVVGVTLTVTCNWESETIEEVGKNGGPTDISIAYDDTLIIIEVKRNSDDCRSQIARYINNYMESQKNDFSETDSIKSKIINLTWSDVIEILKYIQKLSNGNNRIIDDYLSLLESKYPDWFPVAPLSKVKFANKEMVAVRLGRIKEEYIKSRDKDKNKENLLVYSRKSIPVDFKWASEINLESMEDDFIFYKEPDVKYLKLGMWPADTGGQLWQLLTETPNLKFAEERYAKLKLNSHGAIDVRVWPYIKFSHFNRGVEWLSWDEKKERIDIAETCEFAKKITHRWYRDNENKDAKKCWSTLVHAIKNEGGRLFSTADIEKFDEEFDKCFENTNRNYTNVSVGFEVYACIPYETMQKYDQNANDYKTVIDYLQEIINALHDFVVSK